MDLREMGIDGGTEFCGLRIEFNGEFFEHGIEPSLPIKKADYF